jgi:hypothetical protein
MAATLVGLITETRFHCQPTTYNLYPQNRKLYIITGKKSYINLITKENTIIFLTPTLKQLVSFFFSNFKKKFVIYVQYLHN